ncbi:MAG TPA: hypothetical protein VD963_00950 [Phycisphaerales bacterium]|nr:hypothetical protein [Phycisphaerales bacterium]
MRAPTLLAAGLALFTAASAARAQAPTPPAWWGQNLGTNDQVCYDFNDGLYPPTPSQLITAPGCFPPFTTGTPNLGAIAGGRLIVPPGQNSRFRIDICDIQSPPDFKEVYVCVDLYATAVLPGPTVSVNILNVVAPPTQVNVLAVGLTPLPIPGGYVDAVRIAALIRVCPCPATYYFEIWEPNGGFDIDNMWVGGNCFSGSWPPGGGPPPVQQQVPNAPDRPTGPYTFQVNDVPAPGAAALFAIGFPLVLRRRR